LTELLRTPLRGPLTKENVMSTTQPLTDLWNPAPASLGKAKRNWRRAVQAPNPWLLNRFDRSIGFWLGGALLGACGCILGGSRPHRHSVALTISVLWWGIYIGCWGAGIGALLGWWAEQIFVPPCRRSDCADKLPSREDSPRLPTDCKSYDARSEFST